jgi:hypothetical protein
MNAISSYFFWNILTARRKSQTAVSQVSRHLHLSICWQSVWIATLSVSLSNISTNASRRSSCWSVKEYFSIIGNAFGPQKATLHWLHKLSYRQYIKFHTSFLKALKVWLRSKSNSFINCDCQHRLSTATISCDYQLRLSTATVNCGCQLR